LGVISLLNSKGQRKNKQRLEFLPNSADIPQRRRQAAEAGVIKGTGSRPGPWKATLKEPAHDTQQKENLSLTPG
jgi:hypothetical protein